MQLLAPFIMQNFKKSFKSKMVLLPQKLLFSENQLENLAVFIHVFLDAKDQSQMSIHQ